ncbi:hypothetical protein SAMN04488075_0189 [Paracoccus alkenifer]|uniref:Tat pathway signal protein n=2 Tax=Paracoccus alkenifer TaxID=65735 RepID=A0A1H6JGA6_9RHOB|nr:hypothetical protein SAMN04488075_0189 [Paracoccus alkenifer]
MRGIAGAAMAAALILLAGQPASAQERGQDRGILLELNAARPAEDGGCRLTMVVANGLDRGLARAAWQVAIFDRGGIVESLPVLDFGQLIGGKTKVSVFELAGRPCDAIGRIIVNDVAECRAEDGTDLRETCLTGLSARTLTDIEFGI